MLKYVFYAALFLDVKQILILASTTDCLVERYFVVWHSTSPQTGHVYLLPSEAVYLCYFLHSDNFTYIFLHITTSILIFRSSHHIFALLHAGWFSAESVQRVAGIALVSKHNFTLFSNSNIFLCMHFFWHGLSSDLERKCWEVRRIRIQDTLQKFKQQSNVLETTLR